MDVLSYLTNCTVLSTVSQEQDEAQWVKNRMLGVGGSDVGSICGVNKYSSARLVYLTKTGQYEVEFSDEAKERMQWGHKLEPIVADTFAERTGKTVVISPATLRHKDHPWALANVDRFIVDEDGKPYGVLECKTADNRLNQLWAEGEPPLSYIYQLNWYLWITGLEYGAFAALVGGNKFHMIEVWRNDDLLQNEIIPIVDKFWNHNVKGMIQPEMSSSDADAELLKETYTDVVKNSEIQLLEDEHNDLAVVIYEGKQTIKEMEAKVNEATNKLKDLMQNNELGYTMDHTIKWSARKQTRVDTDKLKIDFPEVYEACKKTTSYRVFTIK